MNITGTQQKPGNAKESHKPPEAGDRPEADPPCAGLVSVSDPLRPHGLQPARLLCPWDSPGKETGVGYHFLLQGTFLTRDGTPALVGGFFILGATREAGADTPLSAQKDSPADTLIPDFRSLRPCNNKCLFNFYFFDHATQHVRSQLPNQGSNPHYLKRRRGVLTTGPPGKSLVNARSLGHPVCGALLRQLQQRDRVLGQTTGDDGDIMKLR